MHVTVIGAGIVGACTALELLRDGHEVTIIEAGEPGGRQAASYGHGCWISPASVVPMSMPGLWKQVPGYLLNPHGPLVIRWQHSVRLLPWLVRFLLAGSSLPRVERTAKALSSLLKDSPERHMALAESIGQPELIKREGLLYAYPERADFEREKLAWHLRRLTGLVWRELDEKSLRAREPALSDHYRFGVLAEAGAHCIDPGRYVSALVQEAVTRGARLIKARALGFAMSGDRLIAVRTDQGEIACDRAVITAGVWSKVLARMAGDRIPLESERGYHGVIGAEVSGPAHPVMPSDGKMANTPTAQGLRLSGQVELASVETPPNWKRVDILLDHAAKTYSGLANRQDMPVDRWMGHRPSTPDGKPVIGTASSLRDVIHAFGHGHVGFASGPITGRLAADLVSGKPPERDLSPFSPQRFR
ncbi:FAD-binding oxidoreductase [Allorhizobium sp. BGMRC 0089]|uniref:NAD(P)/FAD-dependent oxidoreductase n=1 Tax=Allorhizobium sonneratiae TaxID=2934936 RepID=UPI0020333022|nr:FAD-binding oxidoreductase [Allorhizobium sonneratiae]MCM2292431.1 FAD-binding oxidoreductase [Allorhizobium sonneratiae]